jgi:NAD-dependent dihydropyrimidine dehydrogenase PreA subunit
MDGPSCTSMFAAVCCTVVGILVRICDSDKFGRSQGDTDFMAYVIAEPCIGTKDTACVDACPVDCIHPKKDNPAYAEEEMLYIDPVECIDCGACVPVCPVSAIFALDDLPEKWKSFTERNAKYFGR